MRFAPVTARLRPAEGCSLLSTAGEQTLGHLAATAGGRLLTSGADKQLKAWTLPDLVLEASFAANGAFGSADGVGGEGALSAADGRVAVGDGGERAAVAQA